MIDEFKYFDEDGNGLRRVSDFLKHASGDDSALMNYHKRNVFQYMVRKYIPKINERGEKIGISKGGPHEKHVVINSDDKFDAHVGTAIHDMAAMMVAKYAGIPFDGFSEEVDYIREEQPLEYLRALESLKAWFEAWKSLDPHVVHLEQSFSSKKLGCGGTPDLVCSYRIRSGWINLVEDWKTSRTLKYQHCVQLGAYSILLKGHGVKIDGARLIHIGKQKEPTFNVLDIPRFSDDWFNLSEFEEDFRACLRLGHRSVERIPL